jgi:hypothetical protein
LNSIFHGIGENFACRALDERPQELLDRQDHTGKLSRAERREAEALVELAKMLSLMKLRAEQICRTQRA